MNALNRLDIKQLVTLRCLLNERNLSRVADQLGVTQQAVSDQLKKLRITFNDRLLVRSGNGMVPTPYAESLVPKLDTAVAALEALLTPDEFIPANANTTLTLSCTDLEQKVILPFLMKRLRLEAPELRIAVKKLDLDLLAQDLLDGNVDLVITNPRMAPDHYPSETLYVERYVCVASMTNTMVKPVMSIAEIAKVPQLVVSPSRGDFSGAVQRWFEEQGHPRDVVMSVPTFTAAKAVLAQTDLCGFIPSRLLPDKELQRIELDQSVPEFDVISVWHQRSSEDPLHQWIRQLLKEVSA